MYRVRQRERGAGEREKLKLKLNILDDKYIGKILKVLGSMI